MTEKQLIKACIDGDAKAQRQLFDQYTTPLFQTSLRYSNSKMDAEDALQDAWLRIFKGLENYKDQGKLMAWMKKIVIHTALRKKERKWFQNENNDIDKVNSPIIEPNAISQMSADEILSLVLGLPEGYKQIFKLFVIEGYSHKEIAELMNIKESTSRAKLTLARKKMKECVVNSNKFYAYGS